MFEKVDYITNIVCEGYLTYYFLHKKTKTLLPLQVTSFRSYRLKEPLTGEPESKETFKKAVTCLGAKIKAIKIYLYQDEQFYSYISVEKEGREIDINSGLLDALEIGIYTKAQILVEKDVLEECGFKVTKKVIEEALASE